MPRSPQDHLLLLVTDHGFVNEHGHVWQTLSTTDGDESFMDARFRSLFPLPHPPLSSLSLPCLLLSLSPSFSSSSLPLPLASSLCLAFYSLLSPSLPLFSNILLCSLHPLSLSFSSSSLPLSSSCLCPAISLYTGTPLI